MPAESEENVSYSDTDLRVLDLLCSHRNLGKVFRFIDIAVAVGKNPRQVALSLDKLHDAGLLYKEKKGQNKGYRAAVLPNRSKPSEFISKSGEKGEKKLFANKLGFIARATPAEKISEVDSSLCLFGATESELSENDLAGFIKASRVLRKKLNASKPLQKNVFLVVPLSELDMNEPPVSKKKSKSTRSSSAKKDEQS